MAVVFFFLPPSIPYSDTADIEDLCHEHGVEECYFVFPDAHRLYAFHRGEDGLQMLRRASRYTSPRLGVILDASGPELAILPTAESAPSH